MTNTVMNATIRWRAAGLLAAAAALGGAAGALGQLPAGEVPPEFEGVGITERLNERLPLDLPFVDEHGNDVTLRDYIEPGRPTILTLNYYTCPQLCHLTLEGLVNGMRDLSWSIGAEFNIVTVTINPKEDPGEARLFKSAYMMRYNREGAEDGWAFLTGAEENIAALADAVGFGYRYDPRSGEYAHPSSIQFITPDGRISRYMNDILFEPRDLRFALVEASEGAIGSPMDRLLLLTCFQFDPDSGSYVPVAWKLMRTGGVMTVIVLALGLTFLWLRGSRYETADAAPQAAPSDS